MLIPLGVANRGGALFPAVFAFGTTLPLLGFAFAMSIVADGVGRYVARVKRVERVLRPLIGVVFLLLGLNDTVVYWLV